MGFNPTFYAGRPKLSEVTIDSDLNMGGRDISNVDTLRADLIRAGRVDSPYTTETWPTETLDWGDGSPTTIISETRGEGTTGGEAFAVETYTVPAGPAGQLRFVTCKISQRNGIRTGQTFGRFYVNGDVYGETAPMEASLPYGTQVTIFSGYVPAGALCRWSVITGRSDVWYDFEFTDAGFVGGAKTFDLSGKWLALGLDMKGLAATVKIQGVEMPYSDYAKYFPLAPTELKIPGGWDASQIRPIVEVYV